MDAWSKTKSDSGCTFKDGLATFGGAYSNFLNIHGELTVCKEDVMEWICRINPMVIEIIESELIHWMPYGYLLIQYKYYGIWKYRKNLGGRTP